LNVTFTLLYKEKESKSANTFFYKTLDTQQDDLPWDLVLVVVVVAAVAAVVAVGKTPF
jgi:hypothetical protein